MTSNPAKIAKLLLEGRFKRRWSALVQDISDEVEGATWDDLIDGIRVASDIRRDDINFEMEQAVDLMLSENGDEP
ncbi:MAG: hypothetical protein E5W74_26725 [Mesorhizobium sp.]|uniref:hypothetical protein n=1 Tax=Mesorhizobium sp. TaxID=1871066 RepID=UPI0012254BEE|nr:hypothetical protein [Mesorhizobium sp.]TIT07320.1 MAG: hypothetical protein E5W74_26725 [Mesorhizobium sp.]